MTATALIKQSIKFMIITKRFAFDVAVHNLIASVFEIHLTTNNHSPPFAHSTSPAPIQEERLFIIF